MSTHKHLDAICITAILLASVLCVVVLCRVEENSAPMVMGYEDLLFDTSKVHTIDIEMDDWDTFLTTAASEEYNLCAVTIDGETIRNVAIRGKGNTSLTTVAAMDSDRYSFKIEFDHYDSSITYHGLDKLCLNNIIQDNTYMKDYVSYRMMDAFGVDAPLCAYVYITVNGEDWGLYLAVEAVEESFLQRNYGTQYGELYKPDSVSMGGGRGNGLDFDMEGFMERQDGAFSDQTAPAQKLDEGIVAGQPPEQQGDRKMPEGDFSGDFGGDFGGGMNSADVKLQYIDDDPDSYSAIFDSAKTDITAADRTRLISSLQKLSNGEDLEQVVDVEKVLRYFVVHNYLVNGDSYTGSMVHNYYLYEKDGQLAMIPWDYNLAFGTFMGGSADSAVNEAIDEVLSDRPMQSWIFSDETYSSRYYALYRQLLEQVDVQALIDDAYDLIAPYVAKDPTAFCTYDEFETGVAALKTFCTLRSESASLQLSGSEAAVDAGELSLSDMGTMDMNSGGGFGNRPDMELPEGMELPDNMTPPDGMNFPDNMTPPAGMDFPDNMTPPDGMDFPDSRTPPEKPE